jgi:hypothetical protein
MDIALKPQYLTDSEGHRKAVVLSLEEFQAIMELIEDQLDAAAFDNAVETSEGLERLEDVAAEFKRDGLL